MFYKQQIFSLHSQPAQVQDILYFPHIITEQAGNDKAPIIPPPAARSVITQAAKLTT